MTEAAFKQDLPPKGGYAPINFKRVPAKRVCFILSILSGLYVCILHIFNEINFLSPVHFFKFLLKPSCNFYNRLIKRKMDLLCMEVDYVLNAKFIYEKAKR